MLAYLVDREHVAEEEHIHTLLSLNHFRGDSRNPNDSVTRNRNQHSKELLSKPQNLMRRFNNTPRSAKPG